MLSNMQTSLGLLVLSPDGVPLRVAIDNPAYSGARDILAEALPDRVAWSRLETLMRNPLQGVFDWATRLGFSLSKTDETYLRFNGRAVKSEFWLPAFQRLMATSGAPQLLRDFAQQLGEGAGDFDVSDVCLHRDSARKNEANLVKMVLLPIAAKVGMTVVGGLDQGKAPFLVSFDHYKLVDGQMQPMSGNVLRQLESAEEGLSFLQEPATLGFDRTYQCQEGTSAGWEVDMSFDCLPAARANLVEMARFGCSDARIVNKITGQVVP